MIRDPGRHSFLPCAAALDHDECRRSADLLSFEIQACHSANLSTPLAEGSTADRLQAGCCCIQMSATD